MQQPPSVVITGGASGIGLGLARALLATGCRVLIADLPGDRLDAAAADLTDSDRALTHPCDVRRYGDVERLWATSVARLGRVDFWLNNAGVGPPMVRYDEVPPEWLDRALDVNLRGVMYGSHVALAGMRAQGGGTIYNTVGFGYDGRKQEHLTVYGTTKAGVRYFTESLARELGRDCPVRVGWLNPGFVLTPMTIEENRRVRERVGEARWRQFRRIMNAVSDLPDETCPWLATRILRGDRPIDRLPPAVFLRRLLAAVVTRPDPLARFGL
ncbi:MAG: SDR family oxidoreductase [Gammaproteobacteria bacterium]